MIQTSTRSKPRSTLALGAFAGAVAGAATVGARSGARPDTWYRRQRKAPFNPPDAIFGPVWTVLYGLIALSGWRVWRTPPGRDRSTALGLWAGQLALNAAWSWIFFKRHRPKAALADLIALDALISAYLTRARKVDRPAAWLMVPYLGWVTFAGVLNEEIVRRNP